MKLKVRFSLRDWFKTNQLLSLKEWTNCGVNKRVEVWRCGPIIIERIEK